MGSANAAEEDPKVVSDSEQVLTRCRALSQRVATYTNRIVGESDALAVEIKSLQQSIGAAEKAAKSLSNKDESKDALALLKQAKDVVNGLGPGGDLRKFCKPRNPMLVRMLLGDKVNMVAIRRDVSQGIREEYHRFRDRSASIMLLGPLTLVVGMAWAESTHGPAAKAPAPGQYIFTPWVLTGIQVYLAWLSYFYLAMALRENVLYVNGSNIRSWWIQHHYWSCIASLVLLGLPIQAPAVSEFIRYFLYWSVAQALVMFVQNRYQRRRMYTRIALGKNSSMDVVAGESSGSQGQLLLLYPMLFALQLCQFAIGGGVAYKTYPSFFSPQGWIEVEDTELRGMRGVCLVGLVFAYMAYRNFITTVATVLEKQRHVRMKRSRSKGDNMAALQGKPKAG